MGDALDRLLGKVGPAISSAEPVLSDRIRDLAGNLADELTALLMRKNGFYGYKSALHMFPSHSRPGEQNLDTWNEPSLWISYFKGDADGAVYFAEDVFGEQFAIKDGAITRFTSEIAGHEVIANSFEGWAQTILSDESHQVGLAYATEWEELRGPLEPGTRLHPAIPFLLDGTDEISNLLAVDAVQGMQLYGDIHVQMRNVPEGKEVALVFTKNKPSILDD